MSSRLEVGIFIMYFYIRSHIVIRRLGALNTVLQALTVLSCHVFDLVDHRLCRQHGSLQIA